MKHLPIFTPPTSGPQIVFNSAKKPFRVARYLYHVQAFKPIDDAAQPYRDGKITLIVTSSLKLKTDFDGLDCLYHKLDYQNYCSKTNNI